ncbi:MAG TPA: serine/threonine-protein kinase [Gemmatimonadaceae bacterium]|nr:serine/threonine-protein kinase [Gemmatimonadaceae bacterium]
MDDLFLSFAQAVSGRYSIDRELGRGGMGIVYLAREVHLDRLVAIKLLPPARAADPSVRGRFLREVRLAAKLSHPNIIPIHAVEETDDFVFYVMAFIDGETLTERVRSRGPLPGSEGVRVLREVAWALAYAHDQGFVHRDVKPDNILIERSSGRVMVADFGIAAALGNASADGVTGTPELMSPEQVLGTTLDGRTDVYGLGASAFFAFSGRYPFEGATSTEILAKQVTLPAPPLASLGLSVPRKVAALVDRCLAKEMDKRPPSAGAVAEQLTLALEQRREVPVALRAFIKRGARMNSGGTLIATITLLPVSIGVAAWLGAVPGFATLLALGAGGPFAYMTAAARRIRLQGFGHGDLAPAFKVEVEQTEEELSSEKGQGQPVLERLTRAAWKTFALGGAAALAGAIAGPPWWLNPSLLILGIGWSGALMTGVVHLAIAQRTQDVDTKFWSRLWLGPMGRNAFKLAARMVGNRALTPAMTHRATELSLGMAAEQLFESLPRDTRKTLAAVPQVLTRLQADAQALRRQQDDLQDAIAAGASDEHFLRLRDSVHAKLAEAVGALETIRLDLLRLHAGSTTVQSITTHLGLAEDVSAEIRRVMAANLDVERLMQFPRLASSTPA